MIESFSVWALLLLGAPQDPAVAVGRITVQGGHGIRGVEQGLLLDRSFDAGCRLPDAPVKPLAASLGAGVTLDVEMISCPAESPAPIRCRAEIGGAFSPWVTAAGSRLTLPLPLPDRTGIYVPSLRCEAGGQALPDLDTTLYLTYAPPRPIVDPPAEIWYRRACTWGGGFRRTAPESQVADALLDRLYGFGQRRWLYYVCTLKKSSAKSCTLFPSQPPRSTEGLSCQGACVSYWTDLVSADSDRNFSDCYVFTEVLQYVAATMGIGGMVDLQTFGAHDSGFVVHQAARAIDPAFPGTSHCGYRNIPCSYSFYNHDLRRWGDRIYDPTFGGIYQGLDEMIAENVVAFSNEGLFLPDSILCYHGTSYGNFPAYVESETCSKPSGQDLALFPRQAPRWEVRPQKEDREEWTLAIAVEVEVRKAGSYLVTGGLYSADGDLITLRADSRRSAQSMRTIQTEKPGLYTVDLTFSGKDVERAQDLGPYTLKSNVETTAPNGAPQVLDTLQVGVPAQLSPEQLASQSPIRLGAPSDLHLQWVVDSGKTYLRATLPVTARLPARVASDARLSSGSETLAYGGGELLLAVGKTILTVDFPLGGLDLPRDGICDLALSLHVLAPENRKNPVNMVDSLLTPVKLPPLRRSEKPLAAPLDVGVPARAPAEERGAGGIDL